MSGISGTRKSSETIRKIKTNEIVYRKTEVNSYKKNPLQVNWGN